MRKMRRMRKIPRVKLDQPVEVAIAATIQGFVDDVRGMLERLHAVPCVVKKRRRRRAAR